PAAKLRTASRSSDLVTTTISDTSSMAAKHSMLCCSMGFPSRGSSTLFSPAPIRLPEPAAAITTATLVPIPLLPASRMLPPASYLLNQKRPDLQHQASLDEKSYKARSIDLGLAKIMRPAAVCRTLVTNTATVWPM